MNLKKIMSPAYKHDQTLLIIYGHGSHKKIKLVCMNICRVSGVEIGPPSCSRGSSNDCKLFENISRSKNNIYYLAQSNPWEWFFTGTINPNKHDRTDLELFHKQLTQWIRDYNKKYDLAIKFLFVPEKHKDGKSWHVHGFIYGLPLSHLKQFHVGDVMGKGLSNKVQNGDVVYNWLAYFNKFGFCDLEPIKNQDAISKYITKYINKDLYKSVTELNAHTYYHSRGLLTKDIKKRGSFDWRNIEPTFKNDYCSVAEFNYTDELYNEFLSRFI